MCCMLYAHPSGHARTMHVRRSAASERVFTLVKSMFGKANDRMLVDGVQGSVLLRYNKRQVG